MKRKIGVLLVVLALLTTILPPALGAQASGFDRFVPVASYTTGRFEDIQSVKWYARYVQAAYEYGLMNGRSEKAFEPDAPVTLAEVVKLASVINATYNRDQIPGSNGGAWYQAYVSYALDKGIIDEGLAGLDEPASRAQIAEIFARALPEEGLEAVNRVDEGAIPDVSSDKPYAGAVYALYAAGVLTGSGQDRAFRPETNVTRAEVAAMAVRLALPDFRESFELRLNLQPDKVFERAASAVFYLEIQDIKGKTIKTGSGFFISEDGLAVTNYHVIRGAKEAVVYTSDGEAHKVLGVLATGKDLNIDLALIQVEGSGFNCLKLADSDAVRVGETVYALGNPLGLKNTFTTGVVSGLNRELDGQTFIQTTAPIASGSSGGVLLDTSGKVVGVTTAYLQSGQNINFIVPINDLQKLQPGALKTLAEILPNTVYYDEYFPVPDFGALAGLKAYNYKGGSVINYVVEGMSYDKLSSALADYRQLLEENCFSYAGFNIIAGDIASYYINQTYGLLVSIRTSQIDGQTCLTIEISEY